MIDQLPQDPRDLHRVIFGAGPRRPATLRGSSASPGHLLGGSGVAGTRPVLVPSDADAITISGQGSEGHLMAAGAHRRSRMQPLPRPAHAPERRNAGRIEPRLQRHGERGRHHLARIAGIALRRRDPERNARGRHPAQLVIDAILDPGPSGDGVALDGDGADQGHKSKGTRGNQITADVRRLPIAGLTITTSPGRLTSGAGADTRSRARKYKARSASTSSRSRTTRRRSSRAGVTT